MSREVSLAFEAMQWWIFVGYGKGNVRVSSYTFRGVRRADDHMLNQGYIPC